MQENLIVKIGADITGLRSNLSSAQKQVQQFSKRIKTLSLGLVGVLAPATWMGANFDREMRFVTSIATRTGEDWNQNFSQMSMTARELGATTEWTAKQVGEGMKFLGMAGFDANQILTAIPGSLDLATAGMIDLGTAADISTNILTQFGLETSEITRVSDVLAKVQSTANTNIQQAAEAFIYGGTMAKQMGMSVEELAGFVGLLANRGIRASLAGTTLRQSMMKILNPSKEAAELMDRYGITVRNADGSLRNFTDVILDMVDANIDAEGATKLLGARAGQLASIFNMTREEIVDYIEQLRYSQGTTKELADIIRNSLWGSFKALWSAMQEVGLSIFDTYKDDMKELIDLGTGYVRFLGEWIRTNKELISQKANLIFDNLKDGLTGIVNFIQRNPSIFKGGLLAYLIGGPLGLATVVGGSALLEKFWKMFFPQTGLEKLKRDLDDVNELLDRHRKTIIEIGRRYDLGQISKESWEEALAAIKEETNKIKIRKALLEESIRTEEKLNDELDEKIRLLGQGTNAINEQTDAAQISWDEIKQILNEEKLAWGSMYVYMTNSAQEAHKKVRDEVKVDYDLVTQMLEEEKFAWGDYVNDVVGYSNYVYAKTSEDFKKAMDDSRSYLDYIKNAFSDAQTEIEPFGKFLYKTILGFAKDSKAALSNFFFDAVKGDIKSFTDYFSSVWNNMLQRATDRLADFVINSALKWAEARAPSWIDRGIGLLSDLFLHEGAWNIGQNRTNNLNSDEFLFVGQRGEMVIPRDVADDVRDAFGPDSDFRSMRAVARAADSQSPASQAFLEATKKSFISGLLKGFAAVSQGQGSITDLLQVSPLIAGTSAIGKGIPAAIRTLAGWTSDQASFGANIGTLANAFLGGNIFTSAIANIVVSGIVEKLADAFDMRTWRGVAGLEAIADSFENAGVGSQAVGQIMNAVAGLRFATDFGGTSEDYLSMLGQYGGSGDEVPYFATPEGAMGLYGYEKGTGIGGLPYTGLVYGHKGEIISNKGESDIIRQLLNRTQPVITFDYDKLASAIANNTDKEIHVHVHVNENEIGYAIANQFKTNGELIESSRRANSYGS